MEGGDEGGERNESGSCREALIWPPVLPNSQMTPCKLQCSQRRRYGTNVQQQLLNRKEKMPKRRIRLLKRSKCRNCTQRTVLRCTSIMEFCSRLHVPTTYFWCRLLGRWIEQNSFAGQIVIAVQRPFAGRLYIIFRSPVGCSPIGLALTGGPVRSPLPYSAVI